LGVDVYDVVTSLVVSKKNFEKAAAAGTVRSCQFPKFGGHCGTDTSRRGDPARDATFSGLGLAARYSLTGRGLPAQNIES